MLLDSIFGPRRAYTAEDRWGAGWGKTGGRTRAGVGVNEETALTLAAWWAGCRILAEAVSSLPFLTYERNGEDRETASTLPLFDLLWRAPNSDMPSGPFREGRVLHQINFGNGFAEIEWDSYEPGRRTQVVALWPIHAGRVRAVSARGEYAGYYAQGYRYAVRNDDQTVTMLRADEMLHVPGIFPDDGVWGKSCVQYHRETIGFGLATERYGAAFFGSGGMPRGVVEELKLKSTEARDEYRRQWKALHGDPDNNELCILPEGAKFSLLTHMTNENAQFLESRAMNKRQVAAILRVPSYMLEEYEKAASYASIEQRSIDFVTISLLPWIRRWEEQCNLKLLLPDQRQRYFVEFELKGLLRGDFASRMTGYVQALTNGIMTINEVRRLENLNGIGPAGDVNYVGLNMTTAQRMLEAPEPTPEAAMPRGGDGAEAADEFTREMLRKIHDQGRELLGLSRQTKPMLQLPHDRATLPVKREAVRDVLADSLRRSATKLANDLKRETGKLTDFEGWLHSFTRGHGPMLSNALEPAAAVLGREDVDGARLWALVAADASRTLGAAFETDTREQFAARLLDWPRMAAEQMAAELVKEEAAHDL